MKKLLMLFAVISALLLAGQAQAIEVVLTNQGTVAWDKVLKLTNGEDIPLDKTVTYNVYKKNTITNVESLVDTTTELQMVITFSEHGFFLTGVSASITYPAGIVDLVDPVVESEITWSDNPDPIRVPNPFVIGYLIGTDVVNGLRPVK